MGTSEAPVAVQIAHSGLAEEVVVVEWIAEDGADVTIGSALVIIESEKAQIEIEAPASGRLQILVPASDIEVAMGTTIAWIYP
jgi:pyruvate dehydrogenase E2 component (dihydrolipoyllysine-residue acetyltransferase)